MSNCRPSVISSSVASVEPSSTVITPSLPTASSASLIRSPISASREAIVPTWAMWSWSSTGMALLLEHLGDLVGGRRDAPAERGRVGAGGHVAQARGHHGLGEHGGGGGAVAGDVVGLGGDGLGELRAEVLERVLELDLARDGDAVVGDGRPTELLVQHDVPAARAEGDLDRVGQLVHPALQRAAGVSSKLICFGMSCLSRFYVQNEHRPGGPRSTGHRGGGDCRAASVS